MVETKRKRKSGISKIKERKRKTRNERKNKVR